MIYKDGFNKSSSKIKFTYFSSYGRIVLQALAEGISMKSLNELDYEMLEIYHKYVGSLGTPLKYGSSKIEKIEGQIYLVIRGDYRPSAISTSIGDRAKSDQRFDYFEK